MALVDLVKVYEHRTGSVAALGPLSLEVAPGEFVAVVGPSGCGKSTLLHIVGDLTPPTSGAVEVNGVSARRAREGRSYGMVFQAPVLLEWRTVADNVALPLEVAGGEGHERGRLVAEALDLVGLAGRGDAFPWQLSGGQQQRVALARSLVTRPPLLLMDEPFAALDEITRERMNDEVLRIRSQTGVTVLFVTHDIDEAVYLADRVVLLSAAPGRVTDAFAIDLPPRTDALRSRSEYLEAVATVRGALRRHGLRGA